MSSRVRDFGALAPQQADVVENVMRRIAIFKVSWNTVRAASFLVDPDDLVRVHDIERVKDFLDVPRIYGRLRAQTAYLAGDSNAVLPVSVLPVLPP
jgi:hypothetical protein